MGVVGLRPAGPRSLPRFAWGPANCGPTILSDGSSMGVVGLLLVGPLRAPALRLGPAFCGLTILSGGSSMGVVGLLLAGPLPTPAPEGQPVGVAAPLSARARTLIDDRLRTLP